MKPSKRLLTYLLIKVLSTCFILIKILTITEIEAVQCQDANGVNVILSDKLVPRKGWSSLIVPSTIDVSRSTIEQRDERTSFSCFPRSRLNSPVAIQLSLIWSFPRYCRFVVKNGVNRITFPQTDSRLATEKTVRKRSYSILVKRWNHGSRSNALSTLRNRDFKEENLYKFLERISLEPFCIDFSFLPIVIHKKTESNARFLLHLTNYNYSN